MMGDVLRFPLERRRVPSEATTDETPRGVVVILPVIRYERHDDAAGPMVPRAGGETRKRRRKSA